MHLRDHPCATVARLDEIANRRGVPQEADFGERREAKSDLYEIVGWHALNLPAGVIDYQ